MKTEVWDWYAKNDPLYAACSDRTRRNNRWEIGEFFETGKTEVQRVLNYLNSIGVKIDFSGEMLEFGCGPGRTTRAFAKHFKHCYGVDISSYMVAKAAELNDFNQDSVGNVTYTVRSVDDITNLRQGRFAFIYTSLVLQHVESLLQVRYLELLVELLKSNGVFTFQLADSFLQPPTTSVRELVTEAREMLQVGNRINNVLGHFGAPVTESEPGMKMYSLEEDLVRKVITHIGGRVIDVRLTNSTEPDFNGNLHFLDIAPSSGWVSKQYVVTR